MLEITVTPTEVTKVDSPRLREIRTALAIDTVGLGRFEIEEVLRMANELSTRMSCEDWGARMGWKIPPYCTTEWIELQTAWLESEDEE